MPEAMQATVLVAFKRRSMFEIPFDEARDLDPAAFGWVLSFTCVPLDTEYDGITVEIAREHYERVLVGMEGRMEHVPPAIEAALSYEAHETIEDYENSLGGS